ncbi:MAG: hypothetical protein FIA82_02175 [Melioribacter sp.]|nr:hypothetical protein [Melioribacter sp.]
MKTKIFLSVLLFLIINILLLAQSDYETLQNFKSQYKQIEESIKNVSSVDECNAISEKINNLRNDFTGNKTFLDKALYPDNFESALVKIEKSLEVKKTDLAQISTLTTQVGSLQVQVTELNQKNEELIKQINELMLKSEKDQATITELKRLVAQLRGNINQRDLLVRDLVDSLLVAFIKSPQNLNQKESQAIMSKVNKANLFYNIERTIADNIQFTKVTQMTADDFSQMKKQYSDFDKVWKQIGPRLSNVYLNKKQKKSEIAQIDSLFVQWNDQIDSGIWRSVNNLFIGKNIYLAPFNNADLFVTNVSAFIDEEIKNIGAKSKNESEDIYYTFADSVYYKTFAKKWLPVLIENNMMTQSQKDVVEAKIEFWKKEAVSSFSYWIYVITIIIILFVVVYIFQRTKKKSIKVE